MTKPLFLAVKWRLRISLGICLLYAGCGIAADFDGDGVADEFATTRDVARAANASAVRLVNPWEKAGSAKRPIKGVGLIIRLSRAQQRFALHDADFFSTPIWLQGKPPALVITKQDRRYSAWKKQVPGLRADVIQLGTEAGIDILLYWDGKRWRLFWPDEEP